MNKSIFVLGILCTMVIPTCQLAAKAGLKLDAGEAEIIYEFIDQDLAPRPEGIAVDRGGNIFVSLRGSDGTTYVRNEIVRISPSGKSRVLTDLGMSEPGTFGVLGLTTDRVGNVYAAFPAGNENHGVWKIDRNGHKWRLPGSEQIRVPNALTFDCVGNLYVTDSYPEEPADPVAPYGPGHVWRYRSCGQFEVWASSELLAPDRQIDPFPFPAPGANGIIYEFPNKLYVANTEKSLILSICIQPDGSAGEVELVAGAWPPTGPPGVLFAPDGLAIDVEGNLYSVLPPAGLAPFPVSPVIKIYPDTGIVEPVIPPYTYPLLPPPYDALFDYPTSLAFGNGRLDNMSLFVVSPTPGQSLSSGPVITQVGVGVPGARFPGFWFDWDDD